MDREYIRVTPSREQINPDDIVSHISSLHKLTVLQRSYSMKERLTPFNSSSSNVPMFEFLALSQGKDSPVEFLYGTVPEHIDTLENRLTTAYPASFDVDRVSVDVLEKIIPPETYKPKDFVKRVKDGHLLFDPDATGTPSDIAGESERTETRDSDNEDENEDTDNSTTESRRENQHGAPQGNGDNPVNDHTAYTKREDLSLDVARPSTTTKQREEAVTDDDETRSLTPSDIDGYSMLEELDAGLLDLVDLPDEVEAAELNHDIEGPTWTEDGEILARPTLENGQPVAVRWHGNGERKKDWMTTLKMFSKVAEPGAPDIQDRAPLATLIQHMAGSDLPIAFQVVFKRIEDWSREAERRKDNLHLNRDTLRQKMMYEFGELIHKPSRERRRERKRDHMEDIGESADTNEQSPMTGDVGKRRKLIDNKIPKRTFRVNIRAVSVANRDVPVEDVERTMHNLTSVLDHIDGYFYELDPDIMTDEQGIRNKQKATQEFHRLVNREIVSGSGRRRPDMVMNADELSNFIAVPSSESLTVKGVRGTRAEAEARDPLPKPDPDLMREFHEPGMRVGYALDKEAEREPVPTQVPPSLLTKHYGRFATTGAGKSKALINDILALHENTGGPIVLIDPKGDGMTENYMKAHYERFGEDDFKENIIHYPIPDILPGFTFFNIEPALEQGMRRSDAIQNKADHYQELLKLVMGKENYEDSKVAPTLISALIKVLFDEYYVEQKQKEKERGEIDSILGERESANKFTHRHLEKLTKQVRLYGSTNGEKGEIPNVSNEPVRDTLEEQAQGDARTFSTIMNAVFNRLNYIREDQHLRKIFNNTDEKFDFRDHLNSDKIILFDMGDLRDDATMVMTGLILTNLWDALQESDRSMCTHGHNSITECKEKARQNGLDPERPQCREEWPDDHLVNIIVDEAASVASSNIINKMLEQGRSFHLSVGLSMQFPEQMKSAGSERVYKNVLNNVATKLIGKITLDEEIAKAMSHEAMDVDEFSDRIKALPRGEWIAQLPSPTFMETGPEPFSLQPMPIPAGHPESDYVFNSETQQRFEHCLDNYIHTVTRREYGISFDEDEDHESPNQQVESIDGSMLEGTHNGTDAEGTADATNGTTSNNSTTDTDSKDDEDDIQMDEINIPNEVLEENPAAAHTSSPPNDGDGDGGTSGTEQETAASGEGDMSVTDGGESGSGAALVTDTVTTETETEDGDAVSETNTSESASGYNEGGFELMTISGQKHASDDLPGHIMWDTEIELFVCKICQSEYFPEERKNAVTCCIDTVEDIATTVGDITNITRPKNENSTLKVTTNAQVNQLTPTDDETIVTVLPQSGIQTQTVPDDSVSEVTRAVDILDCIAETENNDIASILSAVTAAIPPQYQEEREDIIEWVVSQVKNGTMDVNVPTDDLTVPGMRKHIRQTPPAPIDINVTELLNWVSGEEPIDIPDEWVSQTDAEIAAHRFISKPIPQSGTALVRPASIGATYTDTVGLPSNNVSEYIHSPLAFQFTGIDISNASTLSDGNDSNTDTTENSSSDEHETNTGNTNGVEDSGTAAGDSIVDVPVEVVEAPGITNKHLHEYEITRREARFMRAVIKGMNNELDGYSLMDSMSTGIKQYYEDTDHSIDVEKLVTQGYLKEHTGAKRRKYYSVTAEGQKACGLTKKKGREIGDVGSDTPHRVGMELAAQYYEAQPDVYNVKRAASEQGNDTDLVAIDEYGDRIAIVEVEGGNISADNIPGDSDFRGIHNYDSIRKDYEILSESDGQSVWVVRNHEIAASVLQALQSSDEITLDIPSEDIQKLKNRKMPFPRFHKKHIASLDDDGIDVMLTYKQLRDNIST